MSRITLALMLVNYLYIYNSRPIVCLYLLLLVVPNCLGFCFFGLDIKS